MTNSGDESTSKRQRVSRACDLCRKKKIKCDGLVPICNNCKAFNFECSYKDATKKRGPPKGYIEAIETRLHKLENLLVRLSKEDPKSKELLDELNSPLETASGNVIKTRPVRKKSELKGSFDSQTSYKQQSGRGSSTPTTSKSDDIIHSSPATLYDSPILSHHDLTETPSSPDSVSDSTGQLSMEEGGHVRYLGRSSGFYLLQGSRTYHDGAFHLSGYGHKTASTSSKPDHLDPLALPPSDLSEHLIDLYFKHFYPLLPLFYKRQLIPLGEPKETISPLLLNAIYAVASRFSTDIRVRSDPKSQDTAGDVFFERAKCLLDDYYDVPRISTVQALLLLSSHQQGAMKSARAWLYCGLAFRMALDLGLHRNSEHWNITPEERERRKRVFWCCFIVDRLTTAIYGRALCFEERDCDVPFPTVDDDEPIYKTMDRPPPRILDTFVSCIKLCDILGHVLKNIYYAKAHHHSSSHHIDHVLKTLHQQLTSWLSHLPPSLQYNLANTEVGETVPDPPLAVGQLHMIYYTTMILLHRSFIPGPSQTIESQLSLPSYDLCVLGARAILNIINIMLGENHLRYVLNYSVYFTFTAGIIFIKMASSSEFNTAFDAKVNVNKIMRALDEMENTWMNASRCCNILGELAGLRDINLECNEHDTRYVPRRISKTSNPPLAIDVPNSPEPNEENPIIESSAENENITEQQIFDPNIPTSQSSSKDIPVLKDYNNNNNNFKNLIHPFTSVSPSSTSQMSSASAIDPFAAPDTVMNSQQNQVQQSKFDHFGTYFWGVPSSLNIEDWNQYFSQGVSTPTSTQLKTSFADNTSLIPSHDITSSNVPEFSRPFYSNSLGHNTVSTLPSSIASPISSSSMPSTSKKEADVLFSISLPNTPSQSTLLGYNDTNKS